MEPIFSDDELMRKLNVVHKLRKWLQKHKGPVYKSWLFKRVGYGLTKADFDWCVKMLETSDCCTVTTGNDGGQFLALKEANTQRYSPEEVIAHAMQCPPITEELLTKGDV